MSFRRAPCARRRPRTLSAKSTAFLQDRAIRQARLMGYRLVFRSQYYNSYWANTATFTTRFPCLHKHVDGDDHERAHTVRRSATTDLVMVNYHFSRRC